MASSAGLVNGHLERILLLPLCIDLQTVLKWRDEDLRVHLGLFAQRPAEALGADFDSLLQVDWRLLSLRLDQRFLPQLLVAAVGSSEHSVLSVIVVEGILSVLLLRPGVLELSLVWDAGQVQAYNLDLRPLPVLRADTFILAVPLGWRVVLPAEVLFILRKNAAFAWCGLGNGREVDLALRDLLHLADLLNLILIDVPKHLLNIPVAVAT